MPHRSHALTLVQFSVAFIPFGVLLVVAMIWPETTEDPNLNRTLATIWAASVLLGAALVIYPFRNASEGANNLASLFWTFAWVVFLAHAYWAIFLVYYGIADTWREMGPTIAGANFFLTIWWSADVVLGWAIGREPRWLSWAHLAARTFIFLVFAVTLLFLRGGAAQYLGVAFAGTVLLALAARILADVRSAPA